jgi:hypothetical protein
VQARSFDGLHCESGSTNRSPSPFCSEILLEGRSPWQCVSNPFPRRKIPIRFRLMSERRPISLRLDRSRPSHP